MSQPLAASSEGNRDEQAAWLFAAKLLWQESDTRLKSLILIALVLLLFSSAIAGFSPVLLKVIVDSLDPQAGADRVVLAVSLGVAAYALSQWLVRTIGELRTYVVGQADQRLYRRLSLRLYVHVMALPLRFHLDRKTGALSQTLMNGLLGYRMVLHHSVLTVLPVIVELAIMSAVLLTLGHPLFLTIIVATLVCYASAFYVGAIRLVGSSREVSNAQIEANALFTDSILNFETIKAFCAEPRIHERMARAFERTEGQWRKLYLRRATNGIVIGTIFAVSLGTSVFLASRAVQENRMTIGEFVLIHTYLLQIFRPMEMLGFAFREVMQGLSFIDKMTDLFQEQPEETIGAEGGILPSGPGELVFENISFSYQEDVPVLSDVTFRVPAGTTAALVGVSGSGKSSLIRLLVRFWEPNNGRILMDGVPIADIAISDLRQGIAIVPQDTVLFNETIRYNIALGCPDCSVEEVEWAARLASIHEFISSRPNGYETIVGERGLKLSGGEKQRIAIARAALKRPRVFVFDEATSSLDSKTEQQILKNFSAVSSGTTTLVIAHRLSTIVTADQIVVLNGGRIAERGNHADLLRQDGLYRELWQQQRNKGPTRLTAV